MLRNSRTSEVLSDFAVVVLWDVMVFKLDQFLKKVLGDRAKCSILVYKQMLENVFCSFPWFWKQAIL